ncbi:beta-glucosidase [Pseudoduganella lutea]|uniref:beta-glucosidase n=2 Tax=Pseudoduganella lutea TaxID=321985 RepID=A0A4P6L633_9BURK|nr:beta-glucosidase [Pseudoduganella lutea]
MTLDEKVMQLQCIWSGKSALQDPDGSFSPDKASRRLPHGLGMLARPCERQVDVGLDVIGDTGRDVHRDAADTARYSGAVQRWAREHTRLGIPLLLHEEALHGYAARGATSFPQAIALASSFDPALVTEVFGVAAAEMRVRGANLALAPVVDVARDPRWGRIEETFGEDPLLCAEIGKAAVRGFSGDTLPLARGKVLATLKHFAAYGQPESGTNTGPVSVGERVLREEFLAPFEDVLAATKAVAVMPAYNEIDGIPAHGHDWLLNRVLRGEWRFDGIVVGDYGGVGNLANRFKVAADLEQAAAMALAAGVDVDTPDARAFQKLAEGVRAGRIDIALVDQAVARVLRVKFEAGLFEMADADPAAADAATATPAAIALARKAAARCAVLLRNEGGLLPLGADKVGRMLVLGTHARDTPIGGYSGVPRKVVSVLEGLQEEGVRAGFPVAYAEGVRLTEQRIWGQDPINFTPPEVNRRLIAEAVEAARAADTIVMVLGDNEMTAREAWSERHLGDRLGLDLLGQQNALAQAIFDLGKPTVVLLLNGRPLSVNLLARRATALIEGWYMGQETGHAVADLLFGRATPGGKLPVTIARDAGQLPVHYRTKVGARRGYLDGPVEPLYPFGFGLSYTRFAIGAPQLDRSSIRAGESVRVRVEVANVGTREGDEVVQLYLSPESGPVTRATLALRAFHRVTLAPGQRRTVAFTLGPRDFHAWDRAMRRQPAPGTYQVRAGASSVQLASAPLRVLPAA